MKAFRIITKDVCHWGLSYKEMRLKECLYRALRQDYTIIYPDNTVLNVQFER